MNLVYVGLCFFCILCMCVNLFVLYCFDEYWFVSVGVCYLGC